MPEEGTYGSGTYGSDTYGDAGTVEITPVRKPPLA